MGTGTVNESLARGGLPSASKMTQIVHCPASFRLNKDELPKQSSAASDEGTMLHRIMELFALMAINNDTEADVAEFEDSMKKLTPEQTTTVEYATDKLVHLLNRFKNILFFKGDLLEFPERRLELKNATGSVIMSGKGDFFCVKDDGSAFVVDYKFGRGYVEPAERNMQLAALAVLVAEHWQGVSNVEVHIIQPRAEPDRRITSARYDAADIAESRARIMDACDEALNAEKPHEEIGYWCKFCESKYRCRAAQIAMQDQEALIAKGFEITTENVRETFEKAKFVSGLCSEILKKCADVVRANPDIETGLYFAKNASTRSISDTLKALEWLENKLGRELTNAELSKLISFKISDLEAFFVEEIKKQSPDKKITKKTLSETFASELNTLGLIEYKPKADSLKAKE